MAISQVKSKGLPDDGGASGQIAERASTCRRCAHIADNLKIKTSEVEKAISGKKVTADVGIREHPRGHPGHGRWRALGAVSPARPVQTLGGAFDNARPWASGCCWPSTPVRLDRS